MNQLSRQDSRYEFGTGDGTYLKAVSTSATSNTKGSWTELIASTDFNAQGLRLNAIPASSGKFFLADFGIGAAGSEQVLVPNILLQSGLEVRAVEQPLVRVDAERGCLLLVQRAQANHSPATLLQLGVLAGDRLDFDRVPYRLNELRSQLSIAVRHDLLREELHDGSTIAALAVAARAV